MSVPAKRRVSERKKSKGVVMPSVFDIGPRGWGDEVLSVAFFAAALFISISIFSHYRQIQIASEYILIGEVYEIRNAMGRVGNVLSTLLLGFMGYCAFVPVAGLLWLSWYYWTYDRREQEIRVRSRSVLCAGLAVVLLFSCALFAVFFGDNAGGRIGAGLAAPLLRLFDVWGASLFLSLGLLVALAIVSQQSVAVLVSKILRGLAVTAAFCLVTLPVIAARLVHLTIVTIVFGVKYLAHLITGHVYSNPDYKGFGAGSAPALPPPRHRKNSFIITDEDGDGSIEVLEQAGAGSQEEETDEPASSSGPEEQFSHIVVSRKKSDFKLARKEPDGRAREKASDPPSSPPSSAAEQYRDYVLPDVALLTRGGQETVSENDEELIQTSKQIESKLRDFNIQGRVTQVHPGPVITLYEFEPAPGVKVGKISALQDDLAMSLRAVSIRIIAPIPKRGTVGIEIPNKHREIVRLRDVLESEAFVGADSILSVPIGKDTYGEPVVVDIASMPHLLMAGTTGTGKSVCINAILLSLLYRANPADLGLILIDPKILELSVYEGIPHLRVPVVTNARQARAVLDWAVKEMERRYRLMQRYGVRNIDGFNRTAKGEPDSDSEKPAAPPVPDNVLTLSEEDVIEPGIVDAPGTEVPAEELPPVNDGLFQQKLEPLPKIVIVIDELADLMLTVGREIEELITRLAQKARAAGIHLIVATQRPSVDVITGLIKANFPARLSFRVSSRIDSRTILDSMGADKLLGKGDMLFMLPGSVHLKRVHGAFVSDGEVKRVIASLKKTCSPNYDEKIMQLCEKALEEESGGGAGEGEDFDGEYDAFYDKAVELVTQKGQASTSMIQRAFRIGYNRAARIIETMEKEGVIGPMDGVKPRDVLVQNQE